ncbi:MAG: hypothetical protein PHP57_05690 [Sideroxydans sp.]|nr:hypothetical protein [Sideroxydans sp.]
MKPLLLRCLFLTSTLLMSGSVFADMYQRNVLKIQLSMAGYADVAIPTEGAANVVMSFDDKRSQQVYVDVNPKKINGGAFRAIYSMAYRSKEPLPGARLQQLLEENATLAVGAWSLAKQEQYSIVIFIIKLDADADSDELKAAIKMAAIRGDILEQALSGNVDEL